MVEFSLLSGFYWSVLSPFFLHGGVDKRRGAVRGAEVNEHIADNTSTKDREPGVYVHF